MSTETKPTKAKTQEMLCNAHKNLIRDDLIFHSCEWIRKSKRTDFFGASLSASQLPFETQFKHVAQRYGYDVQFQCTEGERDLFKEAYRNCPSHVELLYGSLNELLFGKLQRDKHGLLWRIEDGKRFNRKTASRIKEIVNPKHQITKKEANEKGYYDFIWADYCCNADTQNMNDCIQAMSYMTSGLFYATFSVGKRLSGGAKTAIKKLTGKVALYDETAKSWSYANAITEAMTAKLKAKRIKAKLIYKVVYNGNGNGHMLTVGWEIKTNHIHTTYNENRTAEVKESKLGKNGILANPSRMFLVKNKTKKKNDPIASKIRGDKVRALFLKGKSKEELAKKFNITRNQVGSHLAYLSENLAKRMK